MYTGIESTISLFQSELANYYATEDVSSQASILYKSIAGRYRPISYSDGPITTRYRYIIYSWPLSARQLPGRTDFDRL